MEELMPLDDVKAFTDVLYARYEDNFGESPNRSSLAAALAELYKERVRDFLIAQSCHLSDREVGEVIRQMLSDYTNPRIDLPPPEPLPLEPKVIEEFEDSGVVAVTLPHIAPKRRGRPRRG
jgi:hypothetical protein